MGTSDLILPAVLLLFALRIWRQGARQRRIRIETMWVAPVLFMGMIGAGIAREPPPVTPAVIVVLGLALCAGLGVGWFRGRTTHIVVEPETHQLKGQSSAAGLVLVAGLFLARTASRNYLSGHAAEWGIPPAEIVDGFMLLTLGMIVGRRIEIMLRSRELLAAARAAHERGETVPAEVSQSPA